MNMFITLFLIVALIAFILMMIEMHKAPTVDGKKPFLHDDYDEEKDKTYG